MMVELIGNDGLPESQDNAALTEIAAQISASERREARTIDAVAVPTNGPIVVDGKLVGAVADERILDDML